MARPGQPSERVILKIWVALRDWSPPIRLKAEDRDDPLAEVAQAFLFAVKSHSAVRFARGRVRHTFEGSFICTCIERFLAAGLWHDMKPTLGWTMLSREEMRQVERSLANCEQDTRDEIGFLLIHQGFADRFFPGTSVLHTRIRYALFVPWVYLQAARNRQRGSDLDTTIRRLLIQLAIRLKQLGGEPYDFIEAV